MSRFLFTILSLFLISSSSLPQILLTAALSGSQENPPVTTTGTGTAWVLINPDMNSATYRVTYAQLQSAFTASHFHVGAAGVNGPVVMGITFNGNTAAGTWNNLPDSILAKFLKGDIYINVHSTGNPGGEIRGQLTPANGIGFLASLTGSQENPPVITNASGTAWALFNPVNSQLTYSITFAGLSSAFTASHFHNAPAGTNGGVVEGITFTDSSANGSTGVFTGANLTELLKDRIYINVHSSNNPGGEIRGQLIHEGEIALAGNLTGGQEVPPVTTNGRGTAWGVLSSDLSSLTYDATYARLTGNFTAAHFHFGAPGVSGPVIHGVTFNGNNTSGTWANLPDSVVRHLILGNIYLNVHSSTNPGGEIRGQMEMMPAVPFTAKLTGTQENPPVTTNGRGTGWFWHSTTSTEASFLNYQVTVAGLSSALSASHFHLGAAGINGPVQQGITFTDSTTSGTWSAISDANLAALAKGNIYVNVHTSNNPGGEIRGQVEYTNIISGNIPVELVSFTASAKANSVALNWITSTETNNSGFEVLRIDNGDWKKIGFVNGKGTTTEVQNYFYEDNDLAPGEYHYRLKQIDFDGSFSYSNEVMVNVGTPDRFELSQNYPNPFNPVTKIKYAVPSSLSYKESAGVRSFVELKVYDVLGNEVAILVNEAKEPGEYEIEFNGNKFSSGVYFYTLRAGEFSATKKLILMK